MCLVKLIIFFNSLPSGLLFFRIYPHSFGYASLKWGLAIAGTRSRDFSAFGTNKFANNEIVIKWRERGSVDFFNYELTGI